GQVAKAIFIGAELTWTRESPPTWSRGPARDQRRWRGWLWGRWGGGGGMPPMPWCWWRRSVRPPASLPASAAAAPVDTVARTIAAVIAIVICFNILSSSRTSRTGHPATRLGPAYAA